VSYVRADWLEDEVEAAWPVNQINTETADLLRTVVKEELTHYFHGSSQELKHQTKRLTKLNDEREALLRAHLAGAVPLDLLKTEQDRIAREVTQAKAIIDALSQDTDQVETTLTAALELAQDCDQLYRDAMPAERQRLNQIFFDGIDVKPKNEGVYFRLASPFREISVVINTADPETIREVKAKATAEGWTQPGQYITSQIGGPSKNHDRCRGRGWNLDCLVPPA